MTADDKPARLYLDHAATSWPKPRDVLSSITSHVETCGAAAGRGAYETSRQSDKIVSSLRAEIAKWIGAESANEISFHANGTAAINAAFGGILRDGDHVVTTAADHNSVLRPLHGLASTGKIDYSIVAIDSRGRVNPDDVRSAMTQRTRLVAVTAASNVTGTVQPISEIGDEIADYRASHPSEALFFVDAAQSLGYLSMDVVSSKIDLLAAPGHKGMQGPLGTGFLYARQAVHESIRPTILGGTGSVSESLEMPQDYPIKLEAGNLNVPALAGWLAALQSVPPPTVAYESVIADLAEELYRGIREIPGVRIFADREHPLLPIASIEIAGLSPQDLAMILDSEYGIETRSGFHCAAKVHEAIGSNQQGTLRISAGRTTSFSQTERLVESLRDIVQKMESSG